MGKLQGLGTLGSGAWLLSLSLLPPLGLTGCLSPSSDPAAQPGLAAQINASQSFAVLSPIGQEHEDIPAPVLLHNVKDYGAVGDGRADDTAAVLRAVDQLKRRGGGTLYFPRGYFNVAETIELPPNVEVQGATSLDAGHCQVRLFARAPGRADGKALFLIAGTASNIRIRDIELRSMTAGLSVYPRYDYAFIKKEGTSAIRIVPATSGEGIRDLVFENVRLVNFNYGIDARPTANGRDAPITNVRVRSVSSFENHVALKIENLGATDWDLQNFDVVEMGRGQSGVWLARAGKLKFLQLSCASTLGLADWCLRVREHGPLLFRQMHVEGPRLGFLIDDAPRTSQPIIFENSATFGEIRAPTELILLGNRVPTLPSLAHPFVFTGNGSQSRLLACGNVFLPPYTSDRFVLDATTDAGPARWPGLASPAIDCAFDQRPAALDSFERGALPRSAPGPNDAVVRGVADGVADDTAVIRATLASAPAGGRIVFPAGTYRVTGTIALGAGQVLDGAPGATLLWDPPSPATESALIQVTVLGTDTTIKRGLGVRNLRLRGRGAGTAILLTGNLGASNDQIYQGLQIEGFRDGIRVEPLDGQLGHNQPMFDSLAVRDIIVRDTIHGFYLRSQNASNWNLENIRIEGLRPGQVGMVVDGIGHLAVRGLRCSALEADAPGDACVRVLRQSGLHFEELTATGVRHALWVTWENGHQPFPIVIRRSDLRAGAFFQGRVFLVSIQSQWPATGPAELGAPGALGFAPAGHGHVQNTFPGSSSHVKSCGDSPAAWSYQGILERPIANCN